jgi:hypothetical protein
MVKAVYRRPGDLIDRNYPRKEKKIAKTPRQFQLSLGMHRTMFNATKVSNLGRSHIGMPALNMQSTDSPE